MNAADFRALLKARHHSSFSTSPLIGASPDSIRNWTSGRQKIPGKYLPAIEKLPARPPGKRWSPAEIGHPVEDRLPSAVKSAGEAEAVARPRRRTRSQRLRERPLPEISPAAYDQKHPAQRRPITSLPRQAGSLALSSGS